MAENEKEAKGWLIDNQDLWDNEGDRIVFHCPLEQVPPGVLKIAQAYEQCTKKWDERLKILKQMNVLKSERTYVTEDGTIIEETNW